MICRNMGDLFSCPEGELKNKIISTVLLFAPPKVGMKMNHVILLPSGEGIRNQLISVTDFLFFLFFSFCLPLKISQCLASICGMKSVITVLKAVVWDLQLLLLPCGKLCLELILPEWCQPEFQVLAEQGGCWPENLPSEL